LPPCFVEHVQGHGALEAAVDVMPGLPVPALSDGSRSEFGLVEVIVTDHDDLLVMCEHGGDLQVMHDAPGIVGTGGIARSAHWCLGRSSSSSHRASP